MRNEENEANCGININNTEHLPSSIFHLPSNSYLPSKSHQQPVANNRQKVDYNFLLGRRVERDVVDLTRTFLIRAGTIINERTIVNAQRAGKLVDLTINSSKNNT